MPIASGAKGRPGILAIPGDMGSDLSTGIKQFGTLRRPIRSVPLASSNPLIVGVSKDSAGSPLGGCMVKLFRTSDDTKVDQTVSDAGGNYTLQATGPGPFYIVSYKAGAPDVTGATANTIIGSQTGS